jgi:hypothetical protein
VWHGKGDRGDVNGGPTCQGPCSGSDEMVGLVVTVAVDESSCTIRRGNDRSEVAMMTTAKGECP